MRFSMQMLSILTLVASCAGVLAYDKPALRGEMRPAVPRTLSEIDAEIETLDRQLADIEKYIMSKWICSQDLARIHQEIEDARTQLKTLLGQGGQEERIATLKKDIKEREKVLSEYGKAMEITPDLMNEIKKRKIDLQTERERLTGKPVPAVNEKKKSK